MSLHELFDVLIDRYPEDVEALQDAIGVLQQQRLTRIDRIARLNDAQWQRLGLPLGIETILREEAALLRSVETAHVPPATGEVRLESEGLRRRGESDGTRPSEPVKSLDLPPPADLEFLWRRLLQDTLPEDKQAALQCSWDAITSEHDKYMMFLEYSSYLRKPDISEEDREQRRKELEPLMKEFGLKTEENHCTSVWCVTAAVVFAIIGAVYWSLPDLDPVEILL